MARSAGRAGAIGLLVSLVALSAAVAPAHADGIPAPDPGAKPLDASGTTTSSTTSTTTAAPAEPVIEASDSTTTSTTVAPNATAAVQAAELNAAALTPLVGTFALAAGSCSAGASGTYFRMLQPGGTVNGPDSGYLTNADSTCSNKTYTPLAPGTDGGLVTGSYQPEPNPAFDGSGNSLANRIVNPTKFFGVNFSVSTASTDPQTNTAVAAPSISTDGTNLTGDLRAFSAAWNNAHFNQGAPKPDGTNPGLTAAPTGTYNPTTRAFTITWTSQIVGGPFNSFTGQWHFTGTFAPSTSGTGTGGNGSTSGGSTSGGSGGSSTSGTSGTSASSSKLPNTGTGTTLPFWAGTTLVVLGAGCWCLSRRPSRPRRTP
jgi:LPXTG-motif cell wall-anchored protein